MYRTDEWIEDFDGLKKENATKIQLFSKRVWEAVRALRSDRL
jgi:hypothetical protein